MQEIPNGFVKYYCSDCGRWLGICEKDADLTKIKPYCRMCKENVKCSIERHKFKKVN